jgi:hypothetical protein
VTGARRLLAVGLALAAAAGCAPRVGTLAAAAAHPLSAGQLRAAASRGPGVGRSCRWFVVGIPLGLPQIDEAVAAAAEDAGGAFVRRLGVWSEHRFYGLAGRHCYTVRGEVFG